MKLRIPYTNLSHAIPAITLVAVNGTVMLGPSVQLASVLLVFAIFHRQLRIDLRLPSLILLGYIGICLVFGVLNYGAHQAVIKAGKLGLFCLASILAVRGSGGDKSFPALVALRVFLGLCALNFLYAAASGEEIFRAEFFIEFSIYSSYTIGILVYLARPHLTLFDRGLAWIFALLCGSNMGLLVLILAEVVNRKIHPRVIVAALLVSPVVFYIFNFLMTMRGKELSLSYLLNSDRSVIFRTFYDTTLQTFSTWNWFFGIGVGKPLHEFITADVYFDAYLKRVGEGGIYSYCLHNEVLRILCDFGLVGLLLVGLKLFANCRTPVLFLLGICLLTNSYLYSFSGALVASSLFNPPPSRMRKKVAESKPCASVPDTPSLH